MKPTIFFSAFAALLLTSCGSEPAHTAAKEQAPPVAVGVATVTTQEWPAIYEATGTVRARTTASISSKVMGYVQQVSVQAGDHVREGQLLIALDTRDLDVSVRRAEAGQSEVESSIPELENSIAAAKANLDLAQATFKRMEELAAKKSISAQEFDEASARLKAAQSNYDMARARRAQLNSTMARVAQEVRSAGIMRDYGKLSAPFSGVVVARSVEPGNLATPGAPLLTLEQEGLYRLEASVDESKVGFAKVGQQVDVELDALDHKVSARLAEIIPSVDSASRTYTVKLDLPAAAGLRSGMFGRAIFPIGQQKIVAIPETAVIARGQLQSVFVVEDGVSHTRLITTGRRTKNALEVLSGLSEGEKVVATVPAGLQDGARVEVRQ